MRTIYNILRKWVLKILKKKREWRKRVFEYEHKDSYGIHKWNDIIYRYDKKENKIAGCNSILP